jgi:hypothetical protein
MRPFRTILVVLAATTAVAVLASGAGVASAHTVRFDSDVSIGHGVNPIESTDLFHGEVTSPRTGCAAQRRVTVFQKLDGADQAMGSDRSNQSGAWEVSRHTSEVPDGNYYARVKARDIGPAGHNHICGGARSETIFVS